MTTPKRAPQTLENRMEGPIILVITPVLLFFMWLEYKIGEKQGKALYSFSSVLSDLSNSVSHLLCMALLHFSPLFVYGIIQRNFGLFSVPRHSLLAWVAGFFALDFLTYWQHRSNHRVNLLWRVHLVHHQSPELHLGTAQRIPWLHGLPGWIFFSPLALFGLPLEIFLPLYAIGAFWQFLQHTQVVGKLGWLERVLVTPSHHRVHHAKNPQYIDRNYGLVFIFWDKLFGTFQEEEEAPVYGTTEPLGSWNMLDNNLRPLRELLRAAFRASSFQEGLFILFGPPERFPLKRGISSHEGPDLRSSPRGWWRMYLLCQFSLATLATMAILGWGLRIPEVWRWVLGVWSMWTLTSCGALLDGARRALPWEIVRQALTLVVLGAWLFGWAGALLALSLGLGLFAAARFRKAASLFVAF